MAAIDLDETEELKDEQPRESKATSYTPALSGDSDVRPRGTLPLPRPPGPDESTPTVGPPMYSPALSTSPAAKTLGEFATATGTAKPPQSPLEKMGPAPVPPETNPELGKTEADLRAHAAVTPKYDPVTGQTLQQYKPGVGSRIGRAVMDYFNGGVGGVLGGALGDRNAPGYYGKGAVNSQYFRDETARKQATAADQAKIDSFQREDTTAQRDYKNKLEAYKDEEKTAYNQATTEERARHQQEEEDLKQQANDLKDQLRAITYDPQSKQFMRGDQVYTPKGVEEGAVLEVQHGIKNGPYYQMWQKERRNQPIQIHTGGAKTLSARDQMKLRSYVKANNITMKPGEEYGDVLSPEEIDAALASKPGQNPEDIKLSPEELANFKAETKSQDAELQDLYKDRAMYTAGLGDPKMADSSRSALAGVNKRIQELEAAKDTIRQKYTQNRKPGVVPGRAKTATAPGAAPAGAPGSKGSVTRSQIQKAVNDYNATNPKVKASYEQQKKNFESRGYKVDETK